MKTFSLLGQPVRHSASPAIYAAAFSRLGIDARYRALDVDADRFRAALADCALAGGGNVTVPHKVRAARLITRPADTVRETGACNCFWREGDEVAGANTDVDGFVDAVRALGATVEGGRVCLLGAGGAARAVLAAVGRLNAAAVCVVNRSAARAEALASGDWAVPVVLIDRAAAARGRWELVVNATSLGLSPDDPLPLDLSDVDATAVLDLVYGPDETAWVRHARERGRAAADGLCMLVSQAAEAVRLWYPGVEPPLDDMMRAARGALGGR